MRKDTDILNPKQMHLFVLPKEQIIKQTERKPESILRRAKTVIGVIIQLKLFGHATESIITSCKYVTNEITNLLIESDFFDEEIKAKRKKQKKATSGFAAVYYDVPDFVFS